MRAILILISLLCVTSTAQATVLLNVSGESSSNYDKAFNDGDAITNPPQYAADGWRPAIATSRASCDPGGLAPTGNVCFRWDLANRQIAYRTEFHTGTAPYYLNYTVKEGEILYLAYQTNFTRIGGVDIWHDGGNKSQSQQSAEKGIELEAMDLADFRWVISEGQWSSMCWNTDHHWTIWVGNPTNHFNGAIEVQDSLRPNVAPYGASCGSGLTDGPQLDYERWYNLVMEIKMADDSPKDGYVKIYVNGQLVLYYTGLQVTATNTGSNIGLAGYEIGGTVAQPAYDAPAHIRYHDNFMIATTAADVAGYMVDPETGAAAGAADAIPPSAPQNLRVQ